MSIFKKQKVLHVIGHYLPRTQTFVYDRIRGAINFTPFVITHKMENMDEFPIQKIKHVPLNIAKKVIRKFLRYIGKEPTYTSYLVETDVREIKPDVIQAHFGPEGWRLIELSKKLKIPLVVTFYGFDMSLLPKQEPVWLTRYQVLFRIGAAFFVEGPHMKNKLIELGCLPEKIWLQPIAINVDEYPFRIRKPPVDGKFKLLQVARFGEKKGHVDTIRAFVKVLELFPKTDLYLIGDGPLRQDIQTLIMELGIENRVHFMGEMSREGYIRFAEDCHLFVHPSRTAISGDTEGGAPTVILEAQAMGMPVVATTHADIPFIAPNHSLLCTEKDYLALSDIIIKLLGEDESVWETLILTARQHVYKQHSLTVVMSGIEKVYEDIIRRHAL